MLAGPTISSLVLAGIVDGKDGYRDLVSRLTRWRVHLRWYGALLIAPLLLVVILNVSLWVVVSIVSQTKSRRGAPRPSRGRTVPTYAH